MITDQQERATIWIASELRPAHARRWEEQGIAAFVAKRKHLAFHEVLLDVIACALDPKADTPAVIGQLDWRARLLNVAGTKTQPPEPFDRHGTCAHCGQPQHRCRGGTPLDPHAYESHHDYDRRLTQDPRRTKDTP